MPDPQGIVALQRIGWSTACPTALPQALGNVERRRRVNHAFNGYYAEVK